jgi:hypothetical protein
MKKAIASLLVFGFGLTGFVILDYGKGVLWLIFVIAAYPLALAYTKAGPMPAEDLVQIYKIGVSQIPLIGHLAQGFWSRGSGSTPRKNVDARKTEKRDK